MKKNKNITDQVVQFAIADDLNAKSNYTDQILRLSIVDWTAVALAGKNEPVSKLIRDLENETAGANESVVIGSYNRLPARSAAFSNGVTGHALDYDDTHFQSFVHPSAVVIPASLAVADKINCASAKFYDATLVGVELAIRIGIWLGRKHYLKGFHVTPTAGAFGAAMAAARILDMNFEQAKNAIGLTASRASGIRAQFGTMGKPFHAGIASSSGVEAALLAKKGLISAPNALEEPLGFGETHGGAFFEEAFSGLGKKFVFETITHKFHACCHGTHSTIEALKAIRQKTNFELSEIKKIDLIVNPSYLTICNIDRPKTGLQAKFSFKLAAALAVSEYDTANLNTFSDDLCRLTSLNKLRDLVNVESDTEVSESQTAVSVQLHTGKILKNTYDLSQDLSIQIKERKIRQKARSLIGDSLAMNLWKKVGLANQLPSTWIENNTL